MSGPSYIPNQKCPWVTALDGDRVKLDSLGYVDADHTGGNYAMYVYALKQKKYVWGVEYKQVLPPGPHGEPGAVDIFATRPDFAMDLAGGGFLESKGVGPFTITLDDCTVTGMGLPENRHVIYVLTFVLTK